MLLRSVTVPVYTTLSSESIKYILKDSASKICFVSNNLYLDKVLAIEGELHDLKMIVSFSETDRQAMIPIVSMKKILSESKERNLKEVTNRLEQIARNINDNDLLTIIYT